MKTQTFYRIARGRNYIPDSAPTCCWHTLDAAVRAVEEWMVSNPDKQRYNVNDEPLLWSERKTHEHRVTRLQMNPPDLTPKPDTDSEGCPYVAFIAGRVYVERRPYAMVAEKLTAEVNGVTITGYGPEKKVYTGEWFSGWVKRERWHEGAEAYASVTISIVQDEIVWGDE